MNEKKCIGGVIGAVLVFFVQVSLLSYILLHLKEVASTQKTPSHRVVMEGRHHYLDGVSIRDNPYEDTEFREYWISGYLAEKSEKESIH